MTEVVVSDCETCGKTYERRVKDGESTTYCSRECQAESQSGERDRNQVVLECEYCGGEYKRYPSEADGSRFCSRGCTDAFRKSRPAKYTISEKGYPVWQRTGTGDTVAVHSLTVIAHGADPHRIFGDSVYQVHHKNGRKRDNRPSNLEVLHASEHGERQFELSRRGTYTEEDLYSVMLFMLNPARFLDEDGEVAWWKGVLDGQG